MKNSLQRDQTPSNLKSSAFLLLAAAILTFPSVRGQNASAAAITTGISDNVRQQIAVILDLKRSFTDAEAKLSSNLIFANRQARGISIGPMTGLVNTKNVVDGLIEVDVSASNPAGYEQLTTSAGGRLESSSGTYQQFRARFPVIALHQLAADPTVRWVREADQMILSVGALTSQGYISHGARLAVQGGATGSGVKVGVLSDSASAARVSALLSSSDLGAGTTVLAGLASSGTDEGTAMMEIVQDMAPNAQIFFATANGGQPAMAANIGFLATNGCSIICDDITYFAEGAFQDGPIAQAISTFVANGGIYFSSAGNSGNLSRNTSGTWEGDFVDGGPVTSPVSGTDPGGVFHNFGSQVFDNITTANSLTTLKWSDPLGGSANDYDLFILNSAGTTIKGTSITRQTGTQEPYEAISVSTAVGDRVVIVRFSGSARALRLDTNRGALGISTAGATYGHNAGQSTTTLGATSWESARSGVVPFDGTHNVTETFSSDGPRKVFLNPNGSPITPGNVLFGTGGGTTLQKPDLTAADGVVCKTPGFNPFYGTSAAAPHAAGIAALVKSARPSLTGNQIRQILINTAMDNMALGTDRDGGVGVINAQAAVAAGLTF